MPNGRAVETRRAIGLVNALFPEFEARRQFGFCGLSKAGSIRALFRNPNPPGEDGIRPQMPQANWSDKTNRTYFALRTCNWAKIKAIHSSTSVAPRRRFKMPVGPG